MRYRCTSCDRVTDIPHNSAFHHCVCGSSAWMSPPEMYGTTVSQGYNPAVTHVPACPNCSTLSVRLMRAEGIIRRLVGIGGNRLEYNAPSLANFESAMAEARAFLEGKQ